MATKDHQHCEQKWPGLDPSRDDVKYPDNPKDRFDQLAKRLEEELADLTGQKKGSLMDLRLHGDLSALDYLFRDMDRWDGGHVFSGTLQRGLDELTTIYEQANEKLRIAAGLVRGGGGTLDATDIANLGKDL
ncbi:hypothetical protein ABT294_05125 [Nonomuraea sp. NPDC000554]|uniref:hypothetical protein n=1 Tax=Nonomuraea sp. NPDC000554 TaxID=3154259 RepID=UPI00332438CB